MSMTNKITIYDIARLAGVSPKTVSRVINGGENVKKATYEHVQEIINEKGYTPNIYARNLSNKAMTNILISIKKKKESFPLIWVQTLLDKLLITCRDKSVNAIVEYFGEEDQISDSILAASGSLIDGVIIFYETKDDLRTTFLKKNNVPFIVFGKPMSEETIYVSNDDYGAIYHLFNQMMDKKYKNIWMLMGNKNTVNTERARAAVDFISKNENAKMSVDIFYDLTTIEAVYNFASSHLDIDRLPDSIFVSGDEKVQGLIRACFEKNILIPKNVTIVGFDNIPISEHYTPSLSTIAPNYHKLSSHLLDGLLQLINEKSAKSIEIPTSLIYRQSF